MSFVQLYDEVEKEVRKKYSKEEVLLEYGMGGTMFGRPYGCIKIGGRLSFFDEKNSIEQIIRTVDDLVENYIGNLLQEEGSEMKTEIKYFLEPGAIFSKASAGACGYDIAIIQKPKLCSDVRGVAYWKAPTGVYLELPENIYGNLQPRSSSAKYGYDINPGVIDPDYRGEIFLTFRPGSQLPDLREPCAQIILVPFLSDVKLKAVRSLEDLEITQRGTDGFGSTSDPKGVSK
jgi:dUTPase